MHLYVVFVVPASSSGNPFECCGFLCRRRNYHELNVSQALLSFDAEHATSAIVCASSLVFRRYPVKFSDTYTQPSDIIIQRQTS